MRGDREHVVATADLVLRVLDLSLAFFEEPPHRDVANRGDREPLTTRGGARPAHASAEPVRGRDTSVRGFNVVLRRNGELGYALVSDANAKELAELAAGLAAAAREAAS